MSEKNRVPFWDFDARLFCEGFRQLKTIGILALVVMCLAAVLLPVGVAIDTLSHANVEEVDRELVTVLQVHPLSVVPMYTLSLLMPLILFSFLNKRRTSDFYHALPTSRAGLFVSFFAAIMAWILIALLASTAVSLITCLCMPWLFKIVWSSLLPLLCASFAGALMVAGCMTFAMCITGTLLTNLLVAALLFFGPRILMWYIGALVQEIVRILPDISDIPILDVAYNIPLGILYGVLEGDSTVNVLNNWTGTIYSAVIGVLYFIGALAIFRNRRSEAAEQPAATPLLQTVYRLSLTFLVTLIPAWLIINDIYSKYKMDAAEWFVVFVLYIVAALAFCIYELITTKKAKLLLKAAPTFLIVLLADALLVGGVLLGTNGILAFRPTPEQVHSVSFENTGYGSGNEAYFNELTGEVRITDAKTIELVATHLEKAAELNEPNADMKTEGGWECFNVTIRTKDAQKVRQLYFTNEQAAIIYDALQNNSAYQSAFLLPALTGDVQVSFWDLNEEQAQAVYREMCKDIAKMPFETRYELLQQSHYDAPQAFSVTAAVTVSRYGQMHRLLVPLSAKHYPAAYDLYLQYVYENETVDRKEILNYLSKLGDQHLEIDMNLFSPDMGYEMYFNVDTENMLPSIKTLLTEAIIPALKDTPCAADSYVVDVNVSTPKTEVEKGEVYQYLTYTAHFPLPQELAEGAFKTCADVLTDE